MKKRMKWYQPANCTFVTLEKEIFFFFFKLKNSTGHDNLSVFNEKKDILQLNNFLKNHLRIEISTSQFINHLGLFIHSM